MGVVHIALFDPIPCAAVCSNIVLQYIISLQTSHLPMLKQMSNIIG